MSVGVIFLSILVTGFLAFVLGSGIGSVRMYKWLMEEVGNGKKHHIDVRASLDTAGNLIIAYRLMLHMPHGLYIDTSGQVPVSRVEVERIMSQPPTPVEPPPERIVSSNWDGVAASKYMARFLQNIFYVLHRIGFGRFLQHFGFCEHHERLKRSRLSRTSGSPKTNTAPTSKRLSATCVAAGASRFSESPSACGTCGTANAIGVDACKTCQQVRSEATPNHSSKDFAKAVFENVLPKDADAHVEKKSS